jgi:hypothetical protein
MRHIGLAVFGAAFLLCGCDGRPHYSAQNPPYVLYRNPLAGAGRIHIATFDNPAEDADFNRDVCQADASIINKTGGDGFHWWCEKADQISN